MTTTPAAVPESKGNESQIIEPQKIESQKNESKTPDVAPHTRLNIAWGFLFIVGVVAVSEVTLALVTRFLERIL